MPNRVSLLPSSVPKVTHDPTVTLQGDPMGVLGSNPYGEMTDALLFGAVNTLLGWVDDATGLDLLGIVSPLEGLLGTGTGLLSGFVGFLTPGTGTTGGGVFGPLLGLIPGLGGGAGTLGALGGFLNPTTLLAGGGVFGPILSELGLGNLGQFTSVFGGLDLLTHNPITSFAQDLEQEVIDTVVNALANFSQVGNVLSGIAWFLREPLELLDTLKDGVGHIAQDLQAMGARLEGRIIVVENSKADKTSAIGSVFDNCSTATGFTTISGMTALTSNGDSIRNSGLAGGWHTIGPTEDNHGVRFTLSRKAPGTLRIFTHSDIACANYFGLQIRTDGWGNDYIRTIVGDSPTNAVAIGQWDNRISETWVIDTYYDLATNTFHTAINNAEIDKLLFPDVDHLVTHGSTKWKVGIISNLGNSPFTPGFAVTSFTVYDRQP